MNEVTAYSIADTIWVYISWFVGGYSVKVCGTLSGGKLRRLNEEHCVGPFCVTGLVSVTYAGYFFGASVHPFGCLFSSAKMAIFLEFVGYGMYGRIDNLVQFLWIEVFFILCLLLETLVGTMMCLSISR